MAMIYEPGMLDIIWGATLMGGGGGGSITSGKLLLESFKRANPDREIKVDMLSVDDMEPRAYASATAGMGAPAAIVGVDFSQYAANASNLLKEIADRSKTPLKYNIPVELGGFSVFFPFLLSLQSGGEMPVIDADGAGRAVPALETLLLNVNGCPTTPMALANGVNDRISVELIDPCNAPLAEKIGRSISGMFGNMVGISGWLVNKTQIENEICVGTITLSQLIGNKFRQVADKAPDKHMFEKICGLAAPGTDPIQAKTICTGKITEIVTDTRDGFDFGTLTVAAEDGKRYRIKFQNENLLLQKLDGDETVDMMTVPDITAMYCLHPNGADGIEVNMPISNADAKEGMEIAIGVIKVDKKWFKSDNMKWWTVWSECMRAIDYTGGPIPFEDVPV